MDVRSLAIVLVAAAAQACGGSDGESDGDGESGLRSCDALCSEAQAGECTSVSGDCDAFCGALDRVAPEAGCEGQRQSYQSCLSGSAHVCDTDCASEEGDLETCVGAWCAAHQSEADCGVLVASF